MLQWNTWKMVSIAELVAGATGFGCLHKDVWVKDIGVTPDGEDWL